MYLDGLIGIAARIKSYCHPPCIPNQILNYGLLKESFKLNLGFYHWEISSYLNNAVHLDVFVFALLCLLGV